MMQTETRIIRASGGADDNAGLDRSGVQDSGQLDVWSCA